MDNKEFLNTYKSLYESLKYFSIENSTLILSYNGVYKIPLNNIVLSQLNPNLFLLEPTEILHVLYMLELLFKQLLTDKEINFINNYVKRYLNINDMTLENRDINPDLALYLSTPIYLSYNPDFVNLPASHIIEKILNEHTNEIKNGQGKQMRLVLKNPQFETIEEEDNLQYLEKAGFTTIILIVAAITFTCIYIACFIASK